MNQLKENKIKCELPILLSRNDLSKNIRKLTAFASYHGDVIFSYDII